MCGNSTPRGKRSRSAPEHSLQPYQEAKRWAKVTGFFVLWKRDGIRTTGSSLIIPKSCRLPHPVTWFMKSLIPSVSNLVHSSFAKNALTLNFTKKRRILEDLFSSYFLMFKSWFRQATDSHLSIQFWSTRVSLGLRWILLLRLLFFCLFFFILFICFFCVFTVQANDHHRLCGIRQA